MARVQLLGHLCERCAHIWLPRSDAHPRVCPKCKSPYWDTPRLSQVQESLLGYASEGSIVRGINYPAIDARSLIPS